MSIPLNNLIAYATKTSKQAITHYEWNTVVKTLAIQVNMITEKINSGVMAKVNIHGPSIEPPEDFKEGDLWLKIEED